MDNLNKAWNWPRKIMNSIINALRKERYSANGQSLIAVMS